MSVVDLTPALSALCDICLAGAIVGCAFTLFESVLVLGYTGAARRGGAAQPPLTVLKPLCGSEPGLAARLARFCTQDYEGSVQVVLGARDGDAGAIAVAQEIKAKFPDGDIVLVVDVSNLGGNPKISSLIAMLPHCRYETLVLSDSDIAVEPDYLCGVAALLAMPRVGAVTCLYYGIGEGFWQRLSALAINSHFLPQAIAAARLRPAKHCCGATIALRRSTLERIGGFAAFVDALADDYAIGAAVRSAGYEIATAPFLVGHCCFEDSLRKVALHQMRVARTIRNIAPIGYIGTIITHPWPLALLGLLAGSSTATLVAAAALASRAVLYSCVRRRFGMSSKQGYWLIPLQDIIAFAVYVASFFGKTVHWQGSDYRVTADGNLIEGSASKIEA